MRCIGTPSFWSCLTTVPGPCRCYAGILRQEKSATYKLALIRCISRISDASLNVAREAGEYVELPLGLVALNWIRMFKPLIECRLPQRPGTKMGFVTEAFRALGPLAALDLRLGAIFAEGAASALRSALGDAARLIVDMPARHLTFDDDRPVFPSFYGHMPKPALQLTIDQDLLWAYGTARAALNIWHAMRRMSAYIELMLTPNGSD